MGNCAGKGGANSNAPTDATHSIYVKTGDKKGASTNGNVSIPLVS